MKTSELKHIIAAILVFTIVSGFTFAYNKQWSLLTSAFIFSFIIISLSVLAKKTMAHTLDSAIEHETWKMKHFGLEKTSHLKKPIPAGIIFPLIPTIFSLGLVKFSAFLTYETRAKKHRAAKRFGYYSFTEMTEWHNAVIGAAGIVALLILALVTYLLPYNLESLAKLSIFYAISNLLPISKLDGTQIFFGSRILWTALVAITLIATFLAVTVV